MHRHLLYAYDKHHNSTSLSSFDLCRTIHIKHYRHLLYIYVYLYDNTNKALCIAISCMHMTSIITQRLCFVWRFYITLNIEPCLSASSISFKIYKDYTQHFLYNIFIILIQVPTPDRDRLYPYSNQGH